MISPLPSMMQDTDMITANATKLPSSAGLKAAARRASPEKIDATAQEFEAQFISQMMGAMFSTVEENAVLGGGSAEETYRSFLNNEYGKIIARSGGIGVADHVKREMLKMQETGAQ